jgi:hypothetical protein
MTAPEPTYERVICGARENRGDGTHECVMPYPHPDHAHVYVRLNSKPQEPA